jgi:serine/threonine protein kinase
MQTPNHDLLEQIDTLKKENKALEKERNDAIEPIKALRNEQCDLYEDFKLLRSKYDDLKNEIHHILWEFLPSQDYKDTPGNFSALNEANLSVFESPNRISHYMIGSLLGEGQFANVKLCTDTITQRQFAAKIINKRKVTTLAGLQRVRNEVTILKKLNHPNIVTFVDFIHSPKNVYVITEIGGKDLFEFFDANPSGVTGETARQIILGIVKALLYLHESGICHRDLKPENILLAEKKGELDLHNSVQICDFGQSAISSTRRNLRGFTGLCGSPGFFAPEMILGVGKEYNGFATDVWSVGCIMLELTRGHDEFCRTWMTSYDYDILQNEERFERSMIEAVSVINGNDQNFHATTQTNLVDFLNKILVLDPTNRMKALEMLNHPWLSPENDKRLLMPNQMTCDSKEEIKEEDVVLQDNNLSHQTLLLQLHCLKSPPPDDEDISTNSNNMEAKRKKFRNSLSSRARKHFTTIPVKIAQSHFLYPEKNTNDERSKQLIQLRLPPIEPLTPSSSLKRRQ